MVDIGNEDTVLHKKGCLVGRALVHLSFSEGLLSSEEYGSNPDVVVITFYLCVV